jgi:hypothetical protein
MSLSTSTRLKRSLILGLASCALATAVAVRAPSPAADALGPSGTDAPIGNLTGWRQIFVDDFNTNVPRGSFPDAVSNKWGAYPSPWRDTSGQGVYSPKDVVSIANGVLTKDLHTAGGVHKVAALTPKVPGTSKYGQLYGRYELRMRADTLPGYKIAWMLWPDSGTTTTGAAGGGGNGEIDFPEGELSDNTKIWGFVHRQNATTGGDQAWFRIPVNFNAWHTYTIEWSPGLVVLRIDGVEVGRTTERIPNTPMHWVLQTETSLKMATSDSTRGNVQIDWVAAWAYDPASVATATAADTTGPSVTAGGIAPGATVSGVVNLTADASDPSGVTAVKWYVDGAEVQWDGDGAPWTDPWDSRSIGNGQHSLFAKARDAKGNWGTSARVVFTVAN